MRKVIIESPYAGDRYLNDAYLKLCIMDCFIRGEVSFASHLMYTVSLDDEDKAHRVAGIKAGYEWWNVAEAIVVYTDLGYSRGMMAAISRYNREIAGDPDPNSMGLELEYRSALEMLTRYIENGRKLLCPKTGDWLSQYEARYKDLVNEFLEIYSGKFGYTLGEGIE
jgi:hypothetical protein